MTNTDTKKYRLLKDLPDGAIKGDVYKKVGDRYFNQRLDALKSPVIEHNSYFSWQVEDSLEWFEEVLPESIPNKQEERIEVIFVAETQKFSDGTCDYMFQLSKEVITDKFPAIKKAIEAAINGDTAGIYQSIKDNAPVINYEKNANLDSKLIYEEKPNQSTTPIEDKGWEILSFKGETGLLELDDNKWKYRNSLNSISDIDFLISLYPIHSVRRTSDNEVFTVGDKIGWGIDGSYETTLLGFEIQDGRLKFNDSKKPEHYRWTDFLNALKLHKKSFQPQDKGNVLFTTGHWEVLQDALSKVINDDLAHDEYETLRGMYSNDKANNIILYLKKKLNQ